MAFLATTSGWATTSHTSRQSVRLAVMTPHMWVHRHVPVQIAHFSGFQGDSGGPLKVQSKRDSRYYEIGVTSWGMRSGDSQWDVPGIIVSLKISDNH